MYVKTKDKIKVKLIYLYIIGTDKIEHIFISVYNDMFFDIVFDIIL